MKFFFLRKHPVYGNKSGPEFQWRPAGEFHAKDRDEAYAKASAATKERDLSKLCVMGIAVHPNL